MPWGTSFSPSRLRYGSCPNLFVKSSASCPTWSVFWWACNCVPGDEKGFAMNEPKPDDGGTTRRFEELVSQPGEDHYVLRLYISGLTPRSTEALTTLQSVCEEHLRGRYEPPRRAPHPDRR